MAKAAERAGVMGACAGGSGAGCAELCGREGFCAEFCIECLVGRELEEGGLGMWELVELWKSSFQGLASGYWLFDGVVCTKGRLVCN